MKKKATALEGMMGRIHKESKWVAIYQIKCLDELNTPSATEKRPPTVLAEKPDKKKMKKEKQKKTTKQKGRSFPEWPDDGMYLFMQFLIAPLDLDKQCGVIQGQNNLPCTRSLTCKSHSMGAKRAVEGRSQKYDVLLQAYQKKSIGRPNGKEHVAKKKGMCTYNVSLKSVPTFLARSNI